MHVLVDLEDDLTIGRQPTELAQELRESWLIRAYQKGDLSMGEFSEKMNLSYQQARAWLHKQGVPTLQLGDEARAITHRGYELTKQELGL